MDGGKGARIATSSHGSSLMGDDKWKDIDKEINLMMDWTNSSALLSSSPSNSSGNSRQGHTHRRSEPDVAMIRKALPQPQTATNIPQSAPVQPGGFTLDWSVAQSNIKTQLKNPSMQARHVPTSHINSGSTNLSSLPPSAMNGNLYQTSSVAPGPLSDKLKELSVKPSKYSMLSKEVAGYKNHPNALLKYGDGLEHYHVSRVPPPYPVDHADTTSAPGSGTSSPFHMRADSPGNIVGSISGTHTPPIGGIPEMMPTRGISHTKYQSGHKISSNSPLPHSPAMSRRSSAPGQQMDPRSHSASPSVPRRSTSHTTAMHRSRAQDYSSRFQPGILPGNRQPAYVFQPRRPGTPEVKPPPVAHVPVTTANQSVPFNGYDDQEYTKVLLQHQRERMERLRRELESKKELLNSLTLTVQGMESSVFQRKNEKTSTNLPTLNDVTKLREINRQLEIDCNCMIREVQEVSKSERIKLKRGSSVDERTRISSSIPRIRNTMNKNFHDFITRRNPQPNLRKPDKKDHRRGDLPSPPLPPPPVPPPVESEEESKWSCNWCTFLNHAALNKCEICEYRREMTKSRFQPPQS